MSNNDVKPLSIVIIGRFNKDVEVKEKCIKQYVQEMICPNLVESDFL